LETVFWICISIIFYTYIGYGVLLCGISFLLKLMRPRKKVYMEPFTPTLTLIVTAYNEAGCIEQKIQNTLALQYPPGLLHFIFVTDGSDDGTSDIVAAYPEIKVLHNHVRSGKVAAMHRAMQLVKTEIVVFTDANAILNSDALLYIGDHYRNKKTGAVAGEKRIDISNITDATVGEGFYWRYESMLKKAESECYSVVGAAGELFSFRSVLYEPVPLDTILDDFMISMKISAKGYRIRYEPLACATEKASVSVSEERKRKVRIAAGAIQSMLRLPFLWFPFPQPILWFEYISHRVLRWIVTPYLLVLCFVLNILLAWTGQSNNWIMYFLLAQGLFYVIALLGCFFQKYPLKFKLFFVPYYFCLMNYGMIAGLFRYIFAGQTVIWEKAARR
jgi:biofilm PGA synthesis N-glycosyltransferase PgaC